MWIRSFHKETGKHKFLQIISILLHFVAFFTNYKWRRNRCLEKTEACAQGTERKERRKRSTFMQNASPVLDLGACRNLMRDGSCWALQGMWGSPRFVAEGTGRVQGFPPVRRRQFRSSWGSRALTEAALEGAVVGSATPPFPGYVALAPSSPGYVHTHIPKQERLSRKEGLSESQEQQLAACRIPQERILVREELCRAGRLWRGSSGLGVCRPPISSSR